MNEATYQTIHDNMTAYYKVATGHALAGLLWECIEAAIESDNISAAEFTALDRYYNELVYSVRS